MCEETPAVIYCVGYVLPVACCAAGACMSCYGCYRYYRAGEIRRRRLQRIQMELVNYPDNQPRLKRDTLKRRMIKAFSKSPESTDKDVLGAQLTAVMLKDMREACPICIDTYDSDPKNVFIGLVKKCGHYFHFECLWNWLELNQTCPICREPCDLAETDLQGLSLEQVLKHAMVSESGIEANEKVGMSSDTRSIKSSYSVTSHTSSSGNGVSLATVITTQPRPIQSTKTRGNSLVDRMRAKFEGEQSDDRSDDSDGNDYSHTEAHAGNSNPAFE